MDERDYLLRKAAKMVDSDAAATKARVEDAKARAERIAAIRKAGIQKDKTGAT